MTRPGGRVIDFARFRARRERARRPLFDAGSGRLVAVLDEAPARLAHTERELAHRRRMLAHLGGQK